MGLFFYGLLVVQARDVFHAGFVEEVKNLSKWQSAQESKRAGGTGCTLAPIQALNL
jgi:hypothetical protein